MQWVLNEVQRKLERVRKLTPTNSANSLRFCLQLVLAESGKAINPPDTHTILHPLRIARDPAFDVPYGVNSNWTCLCESCGLYRRSYLKEGVPTSTQLCILTWKVVQCLKEVYFTLVKKETKWITVFV